MQSYNKYSSMDSWLNAVLSTRHKIPQPIATFPAAHILGCTVENLAKDPAAQAMGIKLMAEKYNMRIAMGFMDLSAEAEALAQTASITKKKSLLFPVLLLNLKKTPMHCRFLKLAQDALART